MYPPDIGKFIAVVEFDDGKIVGTIEDPMDVDPNNIRLGSPLEFLTKIEVNESGPPNCLNGFIIPEFGVPEEVVVTVGAVYIYRSESPIGDLYGSVLKELSEKKNIFSRSGKLIVRARSDIKGGENGARRN